MKERLLICNDDGIQMIHHCVPGQAQKSVREWVDFFMVDCKVDVFAFCTARPDKTHHETRVGERDFDRMENAPAQSQLHYKTILDEIRDEGADILHVVVNLVHLRGGRALASIRMSDVHHSDEIFKSLTPQFMLDHPDWRIRQEDGTIGVALDYSFEGVRDHRLAIFRELAENYDLEGLELDFMRSCRYFPAHVAAQKCDVMSAFVGDVRDMLDEVASSRGRDPFLLGVRLPPSLNQCAPMGLDPEMWVAQGWVDYLVPADFMWLDYGTRVEEYAALCRTSDCGVYPCLNPFAAEWVNHREVNAYSPNPVNFNRRVFFSEEHFKGVLRNFHAWGADGIYTFNFCCETIDNPAYAKLAHTMAASPLQTIRTGPATYFYLPIWRREKSHSGGDQTWRTLRFGGDNLGTRKAYRFRMADSRQGERLLGRLRFRVYNLHDADVLAIDLNGVAIDDHAILERRKTNIHVAPDGRYPGMHVPPHVAYEIDLSKCL
jgi:hypothetical protein